MIPRNLFIMWDKPLHESPPLVKFCIDLWVEYNQEYNVEIYDFQTAKEYLKNDFDPIIYDSLKVQHQSDLLRTKLLAEKGGVWVDATCMPHRPIRNWIPEFQHADFSGLKTLTKGQIIDNWFMLARKNSIIMTKQYEALKKYWKIEKINLPQDPRSIKIISENWRYYVSNFVSMDLRLAPYFLWQYIFTSLNENDAEFSDCLKGQPYSSSDGSCGFIALALAKHENLEPPLPEELQTFIISTKAPLSKLIRYNPVTSKMIPEFKKCLEIRRKLEQF